jgi:hypothetical protein
MVACAANPLAHRVVQLFVREKQPHVHAAIDDTQHAVLLLWARGPQARKETAEHTVVYVKFGQLVHVDPAPAERMRDNHTRCIEECCIPRSKPRTVVFGEVLFAVFRCVRGRHTRKNGEGPGTSGAIHRERSYMHTRERHKVPNHLYGASRYSHIERRVAECAWFERVVSLFNKQFHIVEAGVPANTQQI